MKTFNELLMIEVLARFTGNSRGTPIAKKAFIDGAEWAARNAAIISPTPDLMKVLTSIPLIRLQTIAEWMNADDMREFAKNVELAINKANNSEINKGANLVEDMKKTYLDIQILVQSKINKGETLLAFETDGIRADLRNAITAATGEDAQTLQESIEAEAYNKAKGL